MKSLDVLLEGKQIGTLYNRDPLTFEYTDDCLNGLVHSPFASVIPLTRGENAGSAVLAYFENLLPEGDQRRALEELHHVTSVFGLLSTSGWDTAGAIVLLPSGTAASKAHYANQSWADLAKSIAGHTVQKSAVRASVSGAQYKILLSLDNEGNPLLPVNGAPTTHILKPDIKRTGQNILASAANETMVMLTADKCGLPVAGVSYVQEVQSCLVTRYDRVINGEEVRRLQQSDICQLLKVPSDVKYEADGGPGFKDCYDLVKATSTSPIVDCENLLKWLFFNLYTGNNDSHAKNLSILQTQEGPRLAPFYDLMCTAVYSGFSTNFAYQIGGTYKPGEMNHEHLNALAKSIGVSERYLLGLSQSIAKAVNPALEDAFQDLKSTFKHNENILANRLIHKVSSLTKKHSARFLPPAK